MTFGIGSRPQLIFRISSKLTNSHFFVIDDDGDVDLLFLHIKRVLDLTLFNVFDTLIYLQV